MERKSLIVVIAVVAVVFLAGVLYSVWRDTGTEPEGTPALTDADRAEEARGVIAEIRQQQPPMAVPSGSVERGDAGSGQAGAAAADAAPGSSVATPAVAPSDLDSVFERAQAFHREGQLADAQVLYFFAARGGHGNSAFELATMNDPNHHSPETSLLPEADAFQAYRWYSTAAEQGHEAAAERLAALREWAENAAQSGDVEAEQLLLQWE